MLVRHKWPGFLVFVIVVSAGIVYSSLQEKVYEGSVSLRVGSAPNIESFLKIASLVQAGKGVWYLYENKKQTLLETSQAISKEVKREYPETYRSKVDAFVSRVEWRAPNTIDIWVHGKSNESTIRLLREISNNYIQKHSYIADNIEQHLKRQALLTDGLILEIEKELGKTLEKREVQENIKNQGLISGIGRALLLDKKAELLMHKERLATLVEEPYFSRTKRLGASDIVAEKKQPALVKDLFAFMIFGLTFGVITVFVWPLWRH
jgi:hypothetical protein